MVRVLIFLLFFTTGLIKGYGQQSVKKIFLAPHITAIQINTDQFFEVTITTSKDKELVLEAIIEGEYQKDLGLEISENGNTLWIAGAFQPYFKKPNDKLSMHKVVSFSLVVSIPEYKEVSVFGTSSNVQIDGHYEHLNVVLDDGQIEIKNEGDEVSVTTQSGSITLEIESGAVTAHSKYGLVNREPIPLGNGRYMLASTTGNISVKKPQ